jgi:3-carboxy-cis,cis-muconate cycloisomerase
VSDLLWPGDSRAGDLFSDASLITAMTAVESAWLRCLKQSGLAPDVDTALPAVPGLAGVEPGGNPVIPLVAALRAAVTEPTRTWLHRGLTSQDVLDTALVLCLRDTMTQVLQDVRRQVIALRRLADDHRADLRAGRTLTQHAVPTTFGLTAAGWLEGVLDAAEDLATEQRRLPVQAGGAAGTMAAVVSLGGDARELAAALAAELDLVAVRSWHVNRRPVTRVADALTGCVDAWARIANDVLLAVRPEVGELAVANGGGSSTMPHKDNPTLAVLLKRAAVFAPHQAALLHAASAAAVDERPDGAWHAEWLPLALLARATATAASQAAELLEGLEVRTDRMRATAEAASASLLSEQQSMTGRTTDLKDYLGATDQLVDDALARADAFLGSSS